MKKFLYSFLVLGVLLVALPSRAAVIDGEFIEWISIDPLISDSQDVTVSQYYCWDGANWAVVDASSIAACATYYTAYEEMIDIETVKVDDDADNLYIYAKTIRPFFTATVPLADALVPFGGEYDSKTIAGAPANFAHFFIFDIDKEGDGAYDYYITIAISWDNGAVIGTGAVTNGITLHQESGDSAGFDGLDPIVQTLVVGEETIGSENVGFNTSENKGEVEIAIAKSDIDIVLEDLDAITVRMETHSTVKDTTDAASYELYVDPEEILDDIDDDNTPNKPKIVKAGKKYGYKVKKKAKALNANFIKGKVIKRKSKAKVFTVKKFTKKKKKFTKKQKKKLKAGRKYTLKLKSCVYNSAEKNPKDVTCSKWANKKFRVKAKK